MKTTIIMRYLSRLFLLSAILWPACELLEPPNLAQSDDLLLQQKPVEVCCFGCYGDDQSGEISDEDLMLSDEEFDFYLSLDEIPEEPPPPPLPPLKPYEIDSN